MKLTEALHPTVNEEAIETTKYEADTETDTQIGQDKINNQKNRWANRTKIEEAFYVTMTCPLAELKKPISIEICRQKFCLFLKKFGNLK